MRNTNLFTLAVFLLSFTCITAQNSDLNIALVFDLPLDNAAELNYEKRINEELQQLLQHRYNLQLNTYYGDGTSQGFDKIYAEAYAANDILLALGTIGTNYVAKLGDYPKPTVGSIVLDAELQGIKKAENGTSGINNFTYLESPFNTERDLNLLYDIYPFDHLEVLVEKGSIGDEDFIKQLFAKYLSGKDVRVDQLYYDSDIDQHLQEKGDDKVAVYALPYFGADPDRVKQVFMKVNENKVPSAALFGEDYIDAGALIAYETGKNLFKIPRRIALTTLKIVEGAEPSELSVEMQTFNENLLVNMETARQIGIYPNFDLLSEATLINLDNVNTDNQLTLQKAIAQALQRNLDIKIEQVDVSIANTEIGIAQADLYPQIDATTSFAVSDELTTFTRQGAQGRANWLIGGQLSQVVFSEPLLANITIQKLLKASEEKQLLQTQLDVVIDVTSAYMNILFAKNNLNVIQQNVQRNKENYDIAKAKEAIGYTGLSDINRWEAELANANIDLNNAFAGLRQAKFQLNQLLNLPINEPLEVAEANLQESMLLVTDERMGFIDNYGTLDKFSNFIVDYAMKNLPELAQVDLGIKVQERLELSRKRALYLPSLAISGSANRVLSRFDIPEGFAPIDKATTWDIALGLSYPIFQGNNRKKLIEQSRLNLVQLQHTRKNTENQLELLIRANLENVAASYSRMELAQTAALASQKNFKIVQDSYSAGQVNITTLIDAQNNALVSELTATNAIFTFILDFLTLERSIGYFNFLATPSEKDQFFQQVQQYFSQN